MDSNPSNVSWWQRHALILKLLAIGFLTLLLMIPVAIVKDLIRERRDLSEAARQEVSGKWGDSQIISGPVVSIPYLEESKDAKGDPIIRRGQIHLLPETLDIEASAAEELRRRGIHEVILYSVELSLRGAFSAAELETLSDPARRMLWEQARLAVGISDIVGVRDEVRLTWNELSLRTRPGTDNPQLLPAGVSATLPANWRQPGEWRFSATLSLRGSNYMGFMPLGKQTQASLEATWPSPSFDGNFLPESRQVRADGFEARWKVLDLNRNYPQLFLDNTYSFQGSDFGVRFIQPANDYQKNTRTGKYALLVIGLTFLIFFFFEILRKTRIHPFQYLLVGLALVLFYMLVLSISEHLGFAGAYFIASAATIGLICGYGAFIMPPAKNALLLGVFLIAIYGFIYVVLQLEDYALLVGSLGLFAVLAAVMYLSRRVNWYGE